MRGRYILPQKALRNADVKVKNTITVSCWEIILFSALVVVALVLDPLHYVGEKSRGDVGKKEHQHLPYLSSSDPAGKQRNLWDTPLALLLFVFSVSILMKVYKSALHVLPHVLCIVLGNQCFNCLFNSLVKPLLWGGSLCAHLLDIMGCKVCSLVWRNENAISVKDPQQTDNSDLQTKTTPSLYSSWLQ